jgi:dTDP-glucose 4,6-dehydratase
MKLLVTGGAGFIGSNFVVKLLENNEDIEIVNLDKLTYAGRKENLKEVEKNKKHLFVHGDICDEKLVLKLLNDVDAVVNFAAESHVDRAIENSSEFIKTNFFGVHVLLEACRKKDVSEFVQISTDEVYGSIENGFFSENDPLNPRNPYSASKAAAELLVKSYSNTYGLKAKITRSSNNFGPKQFPEKIIPLFITNLLRGKKVPVYGDGKNVRDWLYVFDNCEAIELVLRKGKAGEIYNIGGKCEKTNIELTKIILKEMNASEEMIEFVEDRKGHDFRYALNTSKIEEELGWHPKTPFNKALKDTIQWYKENEWWWKPLVK